MPCMHYNLTYVGSMQAQGGAGERLQHRAGAELRLAVDAFQHHHLVIHLVAHCLVGCMSWAFKWPLARGHTALPAATNAHLFLACYIRMLMDCPSHTQSRGAHASLCLEAHVCMCSIRREEWKCTQNRAQRVYEALAFR